ncbi:MAG: hypothetical protein QY323_04430 [Patescibacteria group bacterium]|nr:MAG: hypothetical protein QY323_04430 [Patescibacteria group bacterium]
MTTSPNENQLLHLAVVVGYARICLAMAERKEFVDVISFSKKHLDLPDFAALPPRLRDVADFEIFELVKDGYTLPNQGADLIAAVAMRDYADCWKMANQALYVRSTDYAKIAPVELKPEWLL